MRDPHVEWLQYQLKTSETIRFENPPPRVEETAAFRLRLADGVLTVEMKEHYPNAVSARAVVDPVLQAWEIDVGLRWGRGAYRFEFERSQIIDRDPASPGESRNVSVAAGTVGLVFGVAARFLTTHRAYPGLPARFVASADVLTLWFRYHLYLDGKEPLLSMAYACLTLLEGSTGATTGTRAAVCRKYNIEQAVRDKLGDIVSERGASHEARKLGAGATQTALTEGETRWVEEVIKALIRRKAEHDADPTAPLPQLRMADFPKI